jgi:hypothetical protein
MWQLDGLDQISLTKKIYWVTGQMGFQVKHYRFFTGIESFRVGSGYILGFY